jgi:hypothetical protein
MIFWRSGINFTKNDRDYIIEYAEKDKNNEKEQCFWVYSAHEAADNEVLCEILTSFRELSRNASSEIAVPKSTREKGKIYAQKDLDFVPFGKVKSAVKGKSEKIYFGNDDENEILTENFLFLAEYFCGESIHKGFNECDLPQNIKIENNNTMSVSDLIANERKDIFISYSHAPEDMPHFEEMKNQLGSLKYFGIDAHVWEDTQIRVGDDWAKTIETALAKTKVAVLLISPSFMSSKLINEKELVSFMELVEREQGKIMPVLLRDVAFHFHPFLKKYQFLNAEKPMNALSQTEKDALYKKLIEVIAEIYACG